VRVVLPVCAEAHRSPVRPSQKAVPPTARIEAHTGLLTVAGLPQGQRTPRRRLRRRPAWSRSTVGQGAALGGRAGWSLTIVRRPSTSHSSSTLRTAPSPATTTRREPEPRPPPEDAWYPLEWANEAREIQRTDRVLARPEVTRCRGGPDRNVPARPGRRGGRVRARPGRRGARRAAPRRIRRGRHRPPRTVCRQRRALRRLGGPRRPRRHRPARALKALADHGELPED
jgi:hypothetical protein